MPTIFLDFDAVMQLREDPDSDEIVFTFNPEIIDFLEESGIDPKQDQIHIFYDLALHDTPPTNELVEMIKSQSDFLSSATIKPGPPITYDEQGSNLGAFISNMFPSSSDQVLVISPHGYIQKDCAAKGIKMVKLYDAGEPSISDMEQLTERLEHQKKDSASKTKVLLDIDETTLIRSPSIAFKTTVTNRYLPPILNTMTSTHQVDPKELYFLTARHSTNWSIITTLEQCKFEIIEWQKWKLLLKETWTNIYKKFQEDINVLSKKMESASPDEINEIALELQEIQADYEVNEANYLLTMSEADIKLKQLTETLEKIKPDVKALERSHSHILSHAKVAEKFKQDHKINISLFEGSFAKDAKVVRNKGSDIYDYYTQWKSEDTSPLTIILFDDDLGQLRSARLKAQAIQTLNQEDRLIVVRIHRQSEYDDPMVVQAIEFLIEIRGNPDSSDEDESSSSDSEETYFYDDNDLIEPELRSTLPDDDKQASIHDYKRTPLTSKEPEESVSEKQRDTVAQMKKDYKKLTDNKPGDTTTTLTSEEIRNKSRSAEALTMTNTSETESESDESDSNQLDPKH